MNMKKLFSALMVLFFIGCSAAVNAAQWKPSLGDTPNIHTTTLEVTLDVNPEFSGSIPLTLKCMDETLWRTEITAKGQGSVSVSLSLDKFTRAEKGKLDEPLRFLAVGGKRGAA